MMTHDWVDNATPGFTVDQEAPFNRLEHHIGIFLMAEVFGPDQASLVTTANEVRGLAINDRQSSNIWRALSGQRAVNGGATAFEWSDLAHNEEGLGKWRTYNYAKHGFGGTILRELTRADRARELTLKFDLIRATTLLPGGRR
jgi:hypothetical protein